MAKKNETIVLVGGLEDCYKDIWIDKKEKFLRLTITKIRISIPKRELANQIYRYGYRLIKIKDEIWG